MGCSIREMSAFDKRSKDFEGANLSESEDLGQSQKSSNIYKTTFFLLLGYLLVF